MPTINKNKLQETFNLFLLYMNIDSILIIISFILIFIFLTLLLTKTFLYFKTYRYATEKIILIFCTIQNLISGSAGRVFLFKSLKYECCSASLALMRSLGS